MRVLIDDDERGARVNVRHLLREHGLTDCLEAAARSRRAPRGRAEAQAHGPGAQEMNQSSSLAPLISGSPIPMCSRAT